MINLIHELYKKCGRPLNLMEVCGTHTVSIFRHGIRSLLPEGLRLLSGPGCPVCVTSIRDVDIAIAFSMRDDVILATFGDMMRVPGGDKSLLQAKAEGAHVTIVYSSLDCLKIAQRHPDKKVVFFSAGFETTAPSVAATVYEAERQGVDNFFLFSVHKLVPPALEMLLTAEEVRIDGLLLPGHVCTVIGTEPYRFIPERHGVPCVVAGFGADDIFATIVMLLKQLSEGSSSVQVQYGSVVRPEGNPKARAFMDEYFEHCDSLWRGIGVIKGSGLRVREQWRHRDAERVMPIEVPEVAEPRGCLCGLVLRGLKAPTECPLFGRACTPERPVGACMVSTEGSCAAYYKYGGSQ